ncbi:MAG: alpha/beta fold hydrolase [Pirellulaceae bacterium]
METTIAFRSFDGTPLEGTYCNADEAGDFVAVLVHGITSSRDELGLYSGLARHLADAKIPSFRFDYRCHGVSSAPVEGLTLAGIVNDIEAAAAAALYKSGAGRVHVVGMSFGGGLSAFWASNTTLTVSSVVMLAPVIDYVEDVLGQHGAIAGGRIVDDQAEQLLRPGFVEMDEIRYGPALINELPLISGVVGLPRLKCESLIIHGDADSIVPYSSSEKFVKLNTACRLVNIPGTDHGFGVEDDDDLTSRETKEKHREVYRIITEFYQKIGT